MEDSNYKILVVDDEEDIVEIVSYNLEKEGYVTEMATNGKEALQKMEYFKPNLIVLDIMMPVMDGMEALKKIRENPNYNDVIILFLTALKNEESEVTGLDEGADDYVVKPIKPKLLMSRINALLRRASGRERSTIQMKDLTIDREKYLVIYKEKKIMLAKKEFELFALLASKPERVFSRQEIMDNVWGNDVIVGDRTIDVHIRKIRQKVGDFITTVKGVGYRFDN